MIPLLLLQCAQCFRTAQAQQAAQAAGMNRGILMLLIPTLALLGGFVWLAWRRRD